MKKRILSLFTTLAMLCGFIGVMPIIDVNATQDRTANFNKSYTLGSNPGQNVANIANAQCNKTQGQLKYTEAWCADFVGDCADLAGQGAAVPRNGGVGKLREGILNAGGSFVTSPQAGDIVIYYCTIEKSYVHAGIMADSKSSYQGNIWQSDGVSYVKYIKNISEYLDSKYHSTKNGLTVEYIRPAYKSYEPVHQHSYTSSITVFPTCTEQGVRTYTCACGDTSIEPIPAEGHSYVDTVVEPTPDNEGYILHKCSKCGDSFTDNKVPPKSSFEGSGTEDSPYKISTAEQLFEFARLLNTEGTVSYFWDKCYILTNDIDLENKEFFPIGTRLTPDSKAGGFSGIFNGQHHSIKGLNVNGELDYSGLFGWCYNGTIKNVSVYGKVKGGVRAGGIVGELGSDGNNVIENCSFNGTIESTDISGGIVGSIWLSGSVKNCYFNGKIIDNNKNTGGIIGYVNAGYKENKGKINIEKCYAVSDETILGGIIGRFNIENSDSEINIANNIYLKGMADIGITGDYKSGTMGVTSDILKSSVAEMLGTPFAENNTSDLNDGYPVFEWQAIPYTFKGKGTDESPYLITSKKELEIFRDLINSEYFSSRYTYSSYLLTTDIDLENEKWIPIGKRWFNGKDVARGFRGHFDGGNHTVKGLYVDESTKYAGFFGATFGGVIENLSVEGTVINTTLSTGGIIGEICGSGGIVRNCCFIGDVTGGDQAVGGIVGYMWQYAKVENCYHIGKVICPEHSAGGIAGKVTLGEKSNISEIINCYHVGKISGISGSIVGIIDGNGTNNAYIDVINCYALKDDGAICGEGEAKTLDVTQLNSEALKKAAVFLGENYADNPDSTFINGYPVFKWQIKSTLVGDVNNDYEVNVSDIVMIQKWLTNKTVITNSNNADINSDGKVDVFDIISLKRKLLK